VRRTLKELSRPIRRLKGNLCAKPEEFKENFNGPSPDNCRQVRIKKEKGGGSMAPFILKFELGLRSVVRFTSQSLNVRKKRVGNPVSRMLNGPRAGLEAIKRERIS